MVEKKSLKVEIFLKGTGPGVLKGTTGVSKIVKNRRFYENCLKLSRGYQNVLKRLKTHYLSILWPCETFSMIDKAKDLKNGLVIFITINMIYGS